MKKVFHFETRRESYSCDAVVLWRFDNRFHLPFSKFLKRLGIINPDPIKIVGGAKSLSSPAQETEREFILDQIRTSMRLHQTKRAILMLHSDCGGYGGLAGGFDNDPSREANHHENELKRAMACLQERIPEIEVQAYFVDFDGVWEIELASPTTRTQAGS